MQTTQGSVPDGTARLRLAFTMIEVPTRRGRNVAALEMSEPLHSGVRLDETVETPKIHS